MAITLHVETVVILQEDEEMLEEDLMGYQTEEDLPDETAGLGGILQSLSIDEPRRKFELSSLENSRVDELLMRCRILTKSSFVTPSGYFLNPKLMHLATLDPSLNETVREGDILNGFLEDETINDYLSIIKGESKKKIVVMSSGFLARFQGPKIRKLKSDYKVDWTDRDLILIPVNLNLHWTLIAIDLVKEEIVYYDSLSIGSDVICELFWTRLSILAAYKTGKPKSIWENSKRDDRSIPQQANAYDCGVFICMFASYLSKEREFDFTQAQMPDIRRYLLLILMDDQPDSVLENFEETLEYSSDEVDFYS